MAAVGLVRGGFEARFTPVVVQLDKARSPAIPFVNCDNRPVENACLLGSADGKPTLLLWGDSHLLAWAPALDESLTTKGVRAVFVPSSACPPMLGVENSVKAICPAKNLRSQELSASPPADQDRGDGSLLEHLLS